VHEEMRFGAIAKSLGLSIWPKLILVRLCRLWSILNGAQEQRSTRKIKRLSTNQGLTSAARWMTDSCDVSLYRPLSRLTLTRGE
jgi:hypothetical protein